MPGKLRPKYQVLRIEESGRTAPGAKTMFATDPDDINSPFVLMPRKDPAAFVAIITYARHCEPELADEIMDWLNEIAEAEPAFGTQGQRNFRATRLRALQDTF